MNLDFFSGMPLEINVTIRLLLAFFLGGFIGLDRELDNQPAGLRTHILVATGSASFTLLFLYGFGPNPDNSGLSRSVSQIITGIGFLGAGVIWQQKDRVRGITTAAGIWVMSSVGMLCAVGLWFLAILVTGLAFITLRFLKPVKERVDERRHKSASNGTEQDLE